MSATVADTYAASSWNMLHTGLGLSVSRCSAVRPVSATTSAARDSLLAWARSSANGER